MDGQIDRWFDKQTDEWTNRQMDRQIDRWMINQTDGWTNVQMALKIRQVDKFYPF